MNNGLNNIYIYIYIIYDYVMILLTYLDLDLDLDSHIECPATLFLGRTNVDDGDCDDSTSG